MSPNEIQMMFEESTKTNSSDDLLKGIDALSVEDLKNLILQIANS